MIMTLIPNWIAVVFPKSSPDHSQYTKHNMKQQKYLMVVWWIGLFTSFGQQVVCLPYCTNKRETKEALLDKTGHSESP